jgi:phosphopentomutase
MGHPPPPDTATTASNTNAAHITVIVLDSVGVGYLPDARQFGATAAHPDGDWGTHTLNHTLMATDTHLPNLAKLGLGHIGGVSSVAAVAAPIGAYGKMLERSLGKDTSTGHWEFMGIVLENPFQVFPEGYPSAIMRAFASAIGQPDPTDGWLCNLPYSGTDVIRDYGEEHQRSAKPIVYTSADSVFQIAAHTDTIPIETLYHWCQVARELLQGPYACARVIARPFNGQYPFERLNEQRKDFSLEPPRNVLDAVFEANIPVIGLGKIPDIYAGRSFSESIHTDNNNDGIEKLLAVLKQQPHGLVFLNLVDFDAKYGHRRDVAGYAKALSDFDARLPELLAALPAGGTLIITSDHGNDPTWFGSDHTREHGMLLAYGPDLAGKSLGTRQSFADIGATVAAVLGVAWDGAGESIYR